MKLALWRDFDTPLFEVQCELEEQPRAFLVWKWDGRLEATQQEIALWRVLAGWFARRLDVDEAKQRACGTIRVSRASRSARRATNPVHTDASKRVCNCATGWASAPH